MTISIKGFDHGNRGAGIRNHQLILPTVVCSTHVSRRIATEVLGQSRRRIDCDAAALFDDFVDAGGDLRNSNVCAASS